MHPSVIFFSLKCYDVHAECQSGSTSDSSDSEFHESDYDMVDDDDEAFEINVDMGIERDTGDMNLRNYATSSYEMSSEGKLGVEFGKDLDYENSDSLHSQDESDDLGSMKRWQEFNQEIDIENPKIEKGMIFSDREALKEAIKQYGRRNRYNLKFVRNEKLRVKAICKEKCTWVLWGSKMSRSDKSDNTWQIKTYNSEHTCSKDIKNRNVTSKWMASHYLHKFVADHKYSITSLQQDVRRDFNLLVHLSKYYRAKQIAQELVLGNAKDQYSKIYDYLQELRQANIGTTTICFLDCRLF